MFQRGLSSVTLSKGHGPTFSHLQLNPPHQALCSAPLPPPSPQYQKSRVLLIQHTPPDIPALSPCPPLKPHTFLRSPSLLQGSLCAAAVGPTCQGPSTAHQGLPTCHKLCPLCKPTPIPLHSSLCLTPISKLPPPPTLAPCLGSQSLGTSLHHNQRNLPLWAVNSQ